MPATSSYEDRTKANSKAASILFKAFNETPVLRETEEGFIVREWTKEDARHITNADVALALRGQRVFEEDELLGAIPASAIKDAVSRGWLVRQQGWLWVTTKAQAALDLPTKVRGQTIKFMKVAK